MLSWIKMETQLRDKPEVIAVAYTLDLERDLVVGKLHRLWSWTDAHCDEKGFARAVSFRFVDEEMGCVGFGKALQSVGWLEEKDGGLHFPGYTKHNGSTAKSRALNAKRNSSMRQRRRDKNVTQPSEKRDAPTVTHASPDKRRGEEKRKEKREEAPEFSHFWELLKGDFQKSGAFCNAWRDWVSINGEIGRPITETAAKAQTDQLALMGLARAVAALRHSTAGRYKGIFEPPAAAKVAVDDSARVEANSAVPYDRVPEDQLATSEEISKLRKKHKF